jgi:hypothetical protein
MLKKDNEFFVSRTPFDCSDNGDGIYYEDHIHFNTIADAYKNTYQLKNNNGQPSIVYSEEFRSKYDNVVGVLGAEYIEKNSGDFIYSCIIHPVDKVYEMYQFIKYVADGISLFQLSESDVKVFTESAGLQGDVLFSKSSLVTLEAYIDIYIERKGNITVANDLFVSPWVFKSTEKINSNLDYALFVTDITSITKGVTYLKSKVGLDLSIPVLYNASKHIRNLCDANPYRRKDVEALLHEEIEIYNTLRKRFL